MDFAFVNLITSASFLWTYYHAQVRNCYTLQIACMCCFVTSWLYHGSRIFGKNKPLVKILVPVFRVLDIIVCQSCVMYFYYQCASFHLLYGAATLAAAYIFLAYYFFKLSRGDNMYSELWHASLHVVANIGISCLIEACYETENCRICNSIIETETGSRLL